MAGVPEAPLMQRLRALSRQAAATSSPLPAEPRLAEALGVSRCQLRESLAQLEQEGFVTRRPRAGTVVNGEAFGIQTWLSWQEPFLETLRRLGYSDARVELLSLQLRRLLPAEADWFGQPPGSSALQVRKRWRGGGRVQMLSDYVVPVPGATTLNEVEGPEDPVFEVARRVSGEMPVWEVANVRAAVMTSEHAEGLEVEPGGAALVLDLVGVSSKGRRLYRIVERHVGDAVAFGFVRTFR